MDRSVIVRNTKSSDFLCVERALCQSNKTTIILVVAFLFNPLEGRINFDR